MITQQPYKYTRGSKAFGGDTKPLVAEQPVTYDTPENVNRCLSCKIPPDQCNGNCEKEPRPGKEGRGQPMRAPVERVAQMIRDGWTDAAICQELGIALNTLIKKKSMCRRAGLLA